MASVAQLVIWVAKSGGGFNTPEGPVELLHGVLDVVASALDRHRPVVQPPTRVVLRAVGLLGAARGVDQA